MRPLRAWLIRAGELFGKRRRDVELAAELESHLQMHIDDNLRAGMSAEEARRQALIKLGGVEQTKESYRERRGLPWLESLLQDMRFGVRMLRKNPGFTTVAVLTLALGIGANTAIFSVINALFLHPPGISNPAQVVALRTRVDKLGLKNIMVSAPDFAQIRDNRQIFASAALTRPATFNYVAADYPQTLRGALVSWQWFNVFEARPFLGRVFSAEEDQPGADHEIVLSYHAWQRWFEGAPSAIGRTIQLNEQPYKIIGVMGPQFRWPDVELWAPIGLPAGSFAVNKEFNESYLAVARLQPGVSFPRARAYLGVLSRRDLETPAFSFGKANGWSLFVMHFTDLVYGNLRMPVKILALAVAFVLLIACANISALLLAKAAGRSREIAVRAALGATRIRLLRQTLVESALLGLAGLLVGVAFGREGVRALLLVAPKDLVDRASFPLDVHVMLYTALIGCAAVLIFGVVPAWHVSQADPYTTLRDSGRSATSGRNQQAFRSFLVVGEIALGFVLLIGTGLLLKTLARMAEVNPGFRPEGVVTAALSLPRTQYDTPQKQIAVFRSILGNASRKPGITAVGAGLPIPFGGGGWSASFEIEGKPTSPGSPGPHGDFRLATRGYFTALGIPLLQGRLFTDEDRLGSQPVAIVDENLARQYWPNRSPIGRKIRQLNPKNPWATIVGVVGHIRFGSLVGEESSTAGSESSSKGAYYFPMYQAGASYGSLIAKGTAGPAVLAGFLRDAVRAVDSNLPVQNIQTMDSLIANSLGPRRFAADLLMVLAALAMLLAAVGLYGLISYSVAQRTNEIGIRVALGAQRSDVMQMVLRQGFQLAIAGIVVGIGMGAALARAVQSLLYRVGPLDPISFISAAGLLLLVTLVACWIPARRAMHVDPMVALRHE
ncbi:MAG: ADOP family duplicated permease [Candidatus Acidiferrales bacterium]